MGSYFTYKNGIKDSVPIALGYLAVSFAFGVSVVGQGLSPLFALFMSATNLTSAGQFAGAAVILAFGSIFEVILTQLVINARYLLMSLTLSQKLDGKWRFIDRLLCSFGITDEIFAVAVSHRGQVGKKYVYGLILLPFLSWSTGTILGALAGNLLPSIILNSLNIALYAMFIAIVIPAGMSDKRLFIVVGVSIAISCVFYYVPLFDGVSSGIAYIICAVVAAVFGAILFPVKTVENDTNGSEYCSADDTADSGAGDSEGRANNTDGTSAISRGCARYGT